jgi:hypothetical protein
LKREFLFLVVSSVFNTLETTMYIGKTFFAQLMEFELDCSGVSFDLLRRDLALREHKSITAAHLM